MGWHREDLFEPRVSDAVTSGSLYGHKRKSSLPLFSPFSSQCYPIYYLRGGGWRFAAEYGRGCSVFVSHVLLFVSLVHPSAGSVSFWLIHVQSEVYYEPPGFNYYTITQSIPCHLIFMAFIMSLYV